MFRLVSLCLLSILLTVSAQLPCKITDKGTEFDGALSVTRTGKTCQQWASQYPHRHYQQTLQGSFFPDGSEYQASNYCRNPDRKDGGPWCYTTRVYPIWEHCEVQKCVNPHLYCKYNQIGKEFIGKLSTTKSGKTCQAWSSQHPHRHTHEMFGYYFPDGDEDRAKNYCRNPNSAGGGPWCYTTDPSTRQEICNVSLCTDRLIFFCKKTPRGTEYRGFLNRTKSGKTCQYWSSQSPQSHNMTVSNGRSFPDGDEIQAMNYCRNPDRFHSGPWCYTTDPLKRYEECAIYYCYDYKRRN